MTDWDWNYDDYFEDDEDEYNPPDDPECPSCGTMGVVCDDDGNIILCPLCVRKE